MFLFLAVIGVFLQVSYRLSILILVPVGPKPTNGEQSIANSWIHESE